MKETVIDVFIGYDSREDIAAEVCKYSILKHASCPVRITYLNLYDLETRGLITRARDPMASTQFTYTRFLVPFLKEFSGYAIFCDCDFVWTTDIKELWDLRDAHKALHVVPHDYQPIGNVKMDGKVQTKYPRKNWSSMMLFNCGHPSSKVLTPDVINDKEPGWLHRFKWCEDTHISFLGKEWNWLVGYYNEKTLGFGPKAIHYTDGGPWFANYIDCEYANVWNTAKEEYLTWSILPGQDRKHLVGIDSLTLTNQSKEMHKQLEGLLLDPSNTYNSHNGQTAFFDSIKQYKRDIIGISDMEDLTELAIQKGFKWDKVVSAFTAGSNGQLYEWKAVLDGVAGKSPIAFRGITKSHIKDWCVENKRDFYFIDTGYFGNAKMKIFHRVTKNNLQYIGKLKDVSSDRFYKTRTTIKPQTTGGKILLCPPSDKAMEYYGEHLATWMEKTIDTIKQHTDREIIVRLKAPRKERILVNTIAEALEDDIHCLVTYNSIAALEALILGKPAFALGENAATPLCLNDLSKIESPLRPTVEEVHYLCSNLAYHQFTLTELQTGKAWELINEWNEK